MCRGFVPTERIPYKSNGRTSRKKSRRIPSAIKNGLDPLNEFNAKRLQIEEMKLNID